MRFVFRRKFKIRGLTVFCAAAVAALHTGSQEIPPGEQIFLPAGTSLPGFFSGHTSLALILTIIYED